MCAALGDSGLFVEGKDLPQNLASLGRKFPEVSVFSGCILRSGAFQEATPMEEIQSSIWPLLMACHGSEGASLGAAGHLKPLKSLVWHA